MDMEINQVRIGKVLVVSVSGRVDTVSAEQLKGFFKSPRVEDFNYILVDLLDLEYICSMGLRVFLELTRNLMARNGHLRLIQPVRPVFEIFQVAGLHECLHFYLTASDALLEWILPEEDKKTAQ